MLYLLNGIQMCDWLTYFLCWLWWGIVHNQKVPHCDSCSDFGKTFWNGDHWLESHSVHQVEYFWKTSWVKEERPTDQLIMTLPYIHLILYCIENYGTPPQLFDSFIRILKTAPKLSTTFKWNKIPKIDTRCIEAFWETFVLMSSV